MLLWVRIPLQTQNIFQKIASCLFSSNLLQSIFTSFCSELLRGCFDIGGIEETWGDRWILSLKNCQFYSIEWEHIEKVMWVRIFQDTFSHVKFCINCFKISKFFIIMSNLHGTYANSVWLMTPLQTIVCCWFYMFWLVTCKKYFWMTICEEIFFIYIF